MHACIYKYICLSVCQYIRLTTNDCGPTFRPHETQSLENRTD